MKNLDKQIQKAKKMLAKKGIVAKSTTIENGFVKLTWEDGDVIYYTLDLEYSTDWGKSIIAKEGMTKEDVVTLIYRNGDIRSYSSDLKYFSSRGTPLLQKILPGRELIKQE